MRIIWNNNRFEAEFAQNEFRADLDAAKSAGFKTTGPPDWVWYTDKSSVVDKLRKNRPPTLAVTELALQKFQQLSQIDSQKQQIREQFKQANKQDKTKSKDPSISGLVEITIPEKGYLDSSDYPPLETKHEFSIPKPPSERCMMCDDPLYLIDYPNVCLWCSLS